MKVLVTGAAGFLGAWVMRRLLEKDLRIRAFDLRRDDRLLHRLSPRHAACVEWGPKGRRQRVVSEPSTDLLDTWLALGGTPNALQRALDA